jgi:hypothetical protein
MLLTEACRQSAICTASESSSAAIAPGRAMPTYFEVGFNDFGEHELPAYCRVNSLVDSDDGRSATVEIDLVQGESAIGDAKVRVSS